VAQDNYKFSDKIGGFMVLITKIKSFLGLGWLLILILGGSLVTNLKAAEAGGGANRYATLSQAEKDTALVKEARAGRVEVVRLLLAAGANVNAQNRYGSTALREAAMHGHVEAVRLLLAAKADVNMQNQNGDTALIEAARDGRVDIVQLLLAAKADVNAQSQWGHTALIYAARGGSVEVVQLLLAAGADVNAQDQNGWTALLVAAQNGRADVVRLLLAAGANVNLQSQNGATALIMAAANGHVELVQLLLAAGANVNLQSQNGGTALIMAAQNGHVEAVRLLLAAGAELPAAGRLPAEQNAMIQTILAELAARKAAFLAAVAAGDLAKINELIDLPMRDRRLVMNAALLALAGSETNIPAADFEQVLYKLLAHGADLNYTELVDIEGAGAIEGKGADAYQQAQELMSALDMAIIANVPDRVDAVLMAGANPELLSNNVLDRLAVANQIAAVADVGDIALKDNPIVIAKMIENANMARAMLISPEIFKTFGEHIAKSLADEDNTLDPVLRYLFHWEEQANDRKKHAERARILATPMPADED
jgi:ankyrin repeat protein